jgi:hypothetical protein
VAEVATGEVEEFPTPAVRSGAGTAAEAPTGGARAVVATGGAKEAPTGGGAGSGRRKEGQREGRSLRTRSLGCDQGGGEG